MAGAMHSSAINEANRQVQAVLREERGQKHGKNTKYDEVKHAATAKYACHYQAAAAARHFSRKLGKSVSKCTINSIMKTYTEQVRKSPRDSKESMDCLPPKKQGRKVLLGSKLDKIVQAYVKGVRDAGSFVRSKNNHCWS